MASKKELIEQAEAQNIFFRASWRKEEIEAAIASGVKFGDLVEQVCPRSGLVFQVAIEDQRVGAIHPEISWYTQHSNTEVRYPAVMAIEQGKSEGLKTWAEFKARIKQALNPEPEVEPDYDFEGAWAAKIDGADAQYRFKRDWLDAVEKGERRKKFNLAAEGDGYFEVCYKSRKGNESRYYYRQVDGKREEITLQDLEAAFPAETAPEDCKEIKEFINKEGSTVIYQGELVTIVKVTSFDKKRQVWDDFEDDWEWEHYSDYVTWYRLATQEESEIFNRKADLKAGVKSAQSEIHQIYSEVSKQKGESPRSEYPSGKRFYLSAGVWNPGHAFVQEEGTNYLWSLKHNFKDGDDWSYNNVGGAYIGLRWISEELSEKFNKLVDRIDRCTAELKELGEVTE